jgi:hypothetical protein
MAQAPASDKPAPEAVAAYKRMLAEIIERRPSGTRQRLADALAKNRSFVSQITNPAYATPIPASHLPAIFTLCHFSSAERQQFTRLYALAHPRKMLRDAPKRGSFAVHLPDLGDAALNRKLHGLVSGFVRDIVKLMDQEREEGKRR